MEALLPLSCENTPIDYEQTLFQALVNEGKHIRVSENFSMIYAPKFLAS
jgi:hypothetical protein